MQNELLKYIMPSIKHRGIKSKDDYRVKMAENQLQKYREQKKEGIAKSKEEIVDIVNEFIEQIGISLPANFNNVIKLKKTKSRRIDYWKIKEETQIEDKNDIVWIKLNVSGCVSVVGTACDIYFSKKVKDTTSSGRINSFLQEEWNEDEVLIFPLVDLSKNPDRLNRSDIESGIGNYLISKEIPILDYYSHNY